MNGVTVTAQMSLDELRTADAVIVGSGMKTREYAADPAFLACLRLDPGRQLIGSQCSGALLLAKLGLLEGVPVCTDLITKPWVIEAGANVVDRPFFASGNVATAGGCLSSQYLAAWVIARRADLEAARSALCYVAPVGEKDEYVDRALGHVHAFLPPRSTCSTAVALAVPPNSCQPTVDGRRLSDPTRWMCRGRPPRCRWGTDSRVLQEVRA